MSDPRFFWEFVGQVGAPVFAATLVGWLLSGQFALLHAILMCLGLGMMTLCHWRTHHRKA